jgi:acyl-CoA synthetase (AMP-forming)/AMP-acid ligase II
VWRYAEIKTLCDIPRHYGRTTPDRMGLLDSHGTTSFAELDVRSNRIANVLLDLNITPGARVAFLGKNTTRYFEILFGVNKAGAALLPLNWRLAAPEIEEILLDSTPEVLIADREYVDLAVQLAGSAGMRLRMIGFDSAQRGGAELDTLMESASASDPAIEVDPWRTAILMYTSGTIGKPKGAQLSHQGYLYLRLCEHLQPSLGYTPDDLMLTVMPLFHAMGVGLSLQALYNGVPVAVYSMPRPGQLIELIARDRPTVVPLVPTVIQMLLDDPNAANADYSSVRLIVYAGAAIGLNLPKRALTEMTCDFMNFYGATETSAGVTFLLPEYHRLEDEARLQSCGRPLPLIDIKVADPDGNELPHGQVGEFLIRSPSLITGYFNQPETTATGIPRWLVSLGRLRLPGLRRAFLSRRSDQGHDRDRRIQCVPHRGRAGRVAARRRVDVRRRGTARRHMGRAGGGRRRTRTWRRPVRAARCRALSRAHRRVQGA